MRIKLLLLACAVAHLAQWTPLAYAEEVPCSQRHNRPMAGDILVLNRDIKYPVPGTDRSRRPIARHRYNEQSCQNGTVTITCYDMVTVASTVSRKIDLAPGTRFEVIRVIDPNSTSIAETYAIRTEGHGEMLLRCSKAKLFRHGEEEDPRPCNSTELEGLFTNLSHKSCAKLPSDQQTSSEPETVQ